MTTLETLVLRLDQIVAILVVDSMLMFALLGIWLYAVIKNDPN